MAAEYVVGSVERKHMRGTGGYNTNSSNENDSPMFTRNSRGDLDGGESVGDDDGSVDAQSICSFLRCTADSVEVGRRRDADGYLTAETFG